MKIWLVYYMVIKFNYWDSANCKLFNLELGQIEKSKGENYRFRAYMVAVQSLKQYPKKVESGEEAKSLVFYFSLIII